MRETAYMCECMFSCIYAHAHIRLQSRIRSSRICVKYLTSFVAFTFSNVIWFSLCTSKGIWSWENHWRYVTERSDNEGWRSVLSEAEVVFVRTPLKASSVHANSTFFRIINLQYRQQLLSWTWSKSDSKEMSSWYLYISLILFSLATAFLAH